jgi:hypothetical protein
MMKMKILWLDDVRDPVKGPWESYIALTLGWGTCDGEQAKDHDIEWVKSYDEFINSIQQQLPQIIFFDHDLADEHMVYYMTSYEENINYQEFKEKTGLDCAKWLVDYCQDNNINLPTYYVHSHNPIGRKNIQSYLDNAKQHLGL